MVVSEWGETLVSSDMQKGREGKAARAYSLQIIYEWNKQINNKRKH